MHWRSAAHLTPTAPAEQLSVRQALSNALIRSYRLRCLMHTAFSLPLFFLGCGVALPLACIAQATPPPFNPGPVWAGRLEPVGDVLYLPPRQRGVQQATTYLHYQGRRYLMQALQYDPQGRLETTEEYQLFAAAGQLTRQLTRQVRYYTQVVGDSLVSEAEERWFIATTAYSSTWRISGRIPPTEPLLGKGARADGQWPTTPGRLHATVGKKAYAWTWTSTGTFQGGPLTPSHRYFGNGVSSGFVDEKGRRFIADAGRANTSLHWERHYQGRGPQYAEECRASFFASASSTERLVYQRTARWRKGWCRTEHFTAFAEAQTGERVPEFEVRHHYTFYPMPKKRSASRTR